MALALNEQFGSEGGFARSSITTDKDSLSARVQNHLILMDKI